MSNSVEALQHYLWHQPLLRSLSAHIANG